MVVNVKGNKKRLQSRPKWVVVVFLFLGLFCAIQIGAGVLSGSGIRNTAGSSTSSEGTNSNLVMNIESIPALSEGKEPPRGIAQTKGLEQKLDAFFGGLRDGFFIESGAYNGIDHSNTLWLERERNWRGLLVEGNPHLADKIRATGRTRSKLMSGCLSITGEVDTVPFKLAGPLGGIVTTMDKTHTTRVENEINSHRPWMANEKDSGKVVDVTCYPLNDLLKAMNVQVVDFWSLDTEGSEVSILKTIDFTSVLFGVVFIESNSKEHRAEVQAFMKSKGFVENTQLNGYQDTAWYHPSYCEKHKCSITLGN